MDNSSTAAADRSSDTDDAPRLTLRFLFHEFLERFLNLESGWLRTGRELMTQPGAMVRRYVAGERAAYASPFAYLVATTALSILVQNALGFREHVVSGLNADAAMSPAQLELLERFTALLFHNILYLSVCVLIPLALLLRVLFRRSGYNLAETLVFALFFGSEMALIGLPITVLFVVLPLGQMGPLLIGLSAAVCYLSYAAAGFFRQRVLLTIVKAGFAYLVSYLLFLLAVAGATLMWVLVVHDTVSAEGSWNPVNAAERGNVAALTRVLNEGADPDMIMKKTALHVAATSGDLEITDVLLEHGADPSLRDYLGRVPMLLALTHGHHEVALRLADAGTDAAATTDQGTTLVFAAALTGDTELVRWAIENGADVNRVRDDDTYPTALMAAAARGHADVVRLLLDHGADPAVENQAHRTACELASTSEIRKLLGADE